MISNIRYFYAMLLLVCISFTAATAQPKCPEWCFCSKSTAEFVCGLPLLSGVCQVAQCSDTDCSPNGWTCKEKVTTPTTLISEQIANEIREEIEKNGGCKGNVCFAIDGSGSINNNEWNDQTRFVNDVMNVLSKFPVRVAATQYSDKNYPIQSLTTDLNGFQAAVSSTKQIGYGTSISSGMVYCNQQLQGQFFEPKAAVVMGDGFQNVDTKSKDEADAIRAKNGLVTVVAAGTHINQQLLDDLTGKDKSLQFTATGPQAQFDAIKLGLLVRDLTVSMCKILQ